VPRVVAGELEHSVAAAVVVTRECWEGVQPRMQRTAVPAADLKAEEASIHMDSEELRRGTAV
jgi:hypothetical protein